MFSTHVSKQLSVYCHGELPPQESRLVAEHLIGCNRCRAEFEEIKLGVKLAEHLPQLSAPDSLWDGLEPLVSRSGDAGEPLQARRSRAWLFLQPRIAAVFIALLLAISLGVFWFYGREARPPGEGRSSWEVARVDGAPKIGSRRIDEKGRLSVGQWLETDASSRAKIDVGSVGEVEIDPNTRVRLVQAKPTEHRLELARGKMSARIWAPPKLFYVDTPSAVAEDLGCAYTLEVDDHGGSLLRVTLGWVSLQLKDRESMVPAGAACATRPRIGPGTPYFEDASETFKRALSRFDFETNPASAGADVLPLEVVVANARRRDTLTLWHLLPRVEGDARELVYGRMAALVPPPDGVTRAGVLALNQQMLDAWKEKLESSWSDPSAATLLKTWRRVWGSGLGKLHGWEGKK